METLLRPRVAGERATQLTATVRAEFAPLIARLPDELAKPRVAERKADFESLEANALTYYMTDLTVQLPWTSPQKEHRAKLIKAVHDHDVYLADWALPLFKGDEKLMVIINDIVKGRGIRDDADDTLRWVTLFRDQWPRVGGQTPVTTKRLDKAEIEATELIRLLDSLEDETPGSPRDLRRRAFTRWYTGYSEIIQLGRYLLRDDPDAMLRFPGIRAERGETEAKGDDDEGEGEGEPKAEVATAPKGETEPKGETAPKVDAEPAAPAKPVIPA